MIDGNCPEAIDNLLILLTFHHVEDVISIIQIEKVSLEMQTALNMSLKIKFIEAYFTYSFIKAYFMIPLPIKKKGREPSLRVGISRAGVLDAGIQGENILRQIYLRILRKEAYRV